MVALLPSRRSSLRSDRGFGDLERMRSPPRAARKILRYSLPAELEIVRSTMSNRFIAGICALLCTSAFPPLFAQSTAPKSEPKPSKAAPLGKVDPTLPTRADLALAYVRFERALQAKPPAN